VRPTCNGDRADENDGFALIENQGGWCPHLLKNPRGHIGIEMLSVSEIVERLGSVLKDKA